MPIKIALGPDVDNRLGKSSGFARIPWCFRQLINRVLTYREAAVYFQVALHCNKEEGYEYGTERIAECLGWSRVNAVYACLNKLVETGFLLKYKTRTAGPRRYQVNIYQRPSVGYTLRKLQTSGYVGPGKKISPAQFDAAFELYQKKDLPHEPTKLQYKRPTSA